MRYFRTALLMMALVVSSTFASAEETKIQEKTMQVPTCTQPVGKIALGKVSCKAAACKNPQTPEAAFIQRIVSMSGVPSFEGIGDALGDMLISALKATGCFEVLERESLEELKQELALAGKEIKLDTADYLIGGSVSSLTMEVRNTNLGLGVIPVLSLVDLKKTTAVLGMDIRVIDVNGGKVTFTKTYEARNSKDGMGIGGGTAFSGIGFGGIYSQLKGSALEEVARDVVIRATADIVNAKEKLKAPVAPPLSSRYP